MDEPTDAWTGPVVIYDRCPTADDEHLAARLADCRTFAANRGCPVVAEHVDFGEDALADGLDALLRYELTEAIRVCGEAGAYLLVWHPDRLSHHSAGRGPVVDRLSGRVLHSRGALVTVRALPEGAVL